MTFAFDNQYAALGPKFYADLLPNPLLNATSVILNEDALPLIDLDKNSFSKEGFLPF